jgi:hypothetical protein
MRVVPAPPGNVAGARSDGFDDGDLFDDGGGGIDSLGTNELAVIGRGVAVADAFVSPDNVARGMTDETGPMRVATGEAIRGVVGGGAIDGVPVRTGGAEGARDGVLEAWVVFPDNVVVPGGVVLPGLRVDVVGCFFRDARPNCPSSMVRKACPSKFKTMLPLKQQLIVPRSSLTTTTTASVSSVMPSAARWRDPRLASSTLVSGIGKKTPARAIFRSRMSTAPS